MASNEVKETSDEGGRSCGAAGTRGPWFETRRYAALLTMTERLLQSWPRRQNKKGGLSAALRIRITHRDCFGVLAHASQ
jgi:hypothetical protein